MDFYYPTIQFGRTRTLTFNSTQYKLNCLLQGIPETIYNDGTLPASVTRRELPSRSICLITAHAAIQTAAKHPKQVVWIQPSDWDKLQQLPAQDCNTDTFRKCVVGSTTASLAAISQDDFN
ncbi:hypothetical protein P153DRAFT_389755 [Dothidotthia symphoricarpi CBS 119687]|uniref:Uncharacterized protein n=1 Tax=Dothidotthia symphoricarpi CBS 119687 TaxID=1392245 RepID=A0A6A6A043_9PLEO|nr:uncharacterized protein P153DRAFT_389755 [Dothidotthia symphoricarpi CBS 119687]KAF2124896.1 hypothetical protein P153DRAFT_389755 [Dothidotthia symphoricarpi CBS 119687]